MSDVRWTPEAAADLLEIHDYLARDAPATAVQVSERIYDSIYSLADFPRRGRPGRMPDTRELPVSRLPYIIVYEIQHDSVVVLRIIHGAMRWP